MIRPHTRRLPEGFDAKMDQVRSKNGRTMSGTFQEHDRWGNTVKISCKCCGTTIADWVPIADPVIRRVEGRVIISEQRVGLRRLSNHATVLFEMEDRIDTDGSKHISRHASAFCSGCARSLTDADLDQAYLCDVECMAHVDEEKGVNQAFVKDVLDYMLSRKPIRILGLEQEIR